MFLIANLHSAKNFAANPIGVMRRAVSFVVLFVLPVFAVFAQDFSNKGKDFWITYPAHIDATASAMGIYITSDVAATGTVTVGAVSIPFSITANTVKRVFIGPNGGGDAPNTNVYLSQQDGIGLGKAIHVTSDKPVVVYAHIVRSARSGATLVLPTAVWGREYIAPSYGNAGASASNGTITVCASESNTVVEITPVVNSANGGRTAGTPYTITLAQPGDVYQVLFTNNADISGTKVRSIATATSACKPIGVFSSTTWTGLDCIGAAGGDNLFQQLFPTRSFGKTFVTAPFINRNYDIVRVFITVPGTVVQKTENGVTTTLTGISAQGFYEFRTSFGTRITADNPVSVVQYVTSQSCKTGCGSSTANPACFADPEMIVLNPIEQTINNITVFSAHQNWVPAGQSQVSRCFLNIIIKSAAAASFRINGAAPAGMFTPIQGTGYSYLQEDVSTLSATQPVQTLAADSSFSAIAYGFGNVESYGYNAGTNVRDLYQYVTIRNDYATVNFPATCVNTPFKFGITLPYQPTKLEWNFYGKFPDVVDNNPVPDSTFVLDGKTLRRFRLPNNYIYNTTGTYKITVLATNPTSDGCSGLQQIDYDLEVFDKPKASFNWLHSGCLSDSVKFFDRTVDTPRNVYKWSWDFGDGGSDSVANPVKLFSTPGTYNVKLNVITDVGCLGDTTKTITITPPPVAKFGVQDTLCAGKSVTFTDSSTTVGGALVKWIWDYGDGRKDTLAANTPRTITYSAPGTYTVSLKVQANGGCTSIAFTKQVTINALPVADFALPGNICLPAGAAQFTDLSTISDGSQAAFKWDWSFGDGGTATVKNPVHNYTGAGPFTVKLTITSNKGCSKDTSKALTTIFDRPAAGFNGGLEICFRDTAAFTDASSAPGQAVTRYRWDYGDGSAIDTTVAVKHYFAAAGTYQVKHWIFSDKGCISDTITKTITVLAPPTAAFTVSAACAGQAATFTSTSVPNGGNITRWQWATGDGRLVDTTNGNPFNHIYAASGSYNAWLKVTTDKGCKSDTLFKNIQINVLPVANFGLPFVCLSDAFAVFTDSSTISDGTQNLFQYTWNFGDAGSPTNITNTKNGQHKYTAAGVYTVTLQVRSNNGCVATATKQVTINGDQPKASFDVVNTGNICSDKAVQLRNTSTVGFGNVSKVEIYWDNIGNPAQKDTDNNASSGKIYSHQYPAFSTPLTRTFQVRFLAYSGGVCVDDTLQTITINAVPNAQFAAVPPVCADVTAFQLTQASEAGGLAGTGVFSGRGVSSTGVFSPAAAGAGLHTILYVFTTAAGCNDSATQSIRVWPVPVVNAGSDLGVLEGGQVMIRATATGATGLQYAWTPATYLNNDTTLQPLTTPLADIEYTLTVTGDGGCEAFDVVKVKVLKGLEIPNVFSPNGDGINDTWSILYLDTYPGSTVQVFDRYGREAFSSRGYPKAWDGRKNGTELPAGVYYYVIDPKNGRKPYTGSLTILR